MIYTGFPLKKEDGTNNYGPTTHAVDCQIMCQKKKKEGCIWFNWDGDCYLKTDAGNLKVEKGSITGPAQCDANTTTTTTRTTTNTDTTIPTTTTTTTAATTTTTTSTTSNIYT